MREVCSFVVLWQDEIGRQGVAQSGFSTLEAAEEWLCSWSGVGEFKNKTLYLAETRNSRPKPF